MQTTSLFEMVILFSLHAERSALLSDLRTSEYPGGYFMFLFTAQNLDLQDLR